MKIVSFTVSNYRSISTAYKLPLADYSVIVGPNNEGKSNILKGLAIALSILSTNRIYGNTAKRFIRRENITFKFGRLLARFEYDWMLDFPISKQTTDPTVKQNLY